MGRIVAVAGLSGAGKSTVIDFLLKKGSFKRIYLGAFVTKEVENRGMPASPESERAVRLSLRQTGGQAAILELARDSILSCVAGEHDALVDALFCPEERDVLEQICYLEAPLILAVTASFELRARRLAVRAERPFTDAELRSRDKTELEKLRTGDVVSGAHFIISNEGSLASLNEKTDGFLRFYESG